jgi:mono/diheme cytochrome c family protein
MRKCAWGFILGLLVVPVLVGIGALLGYLPVRATAEPPFVEQVVARAALHRSVARGAAALRNTLPVNEANLLEGMKYYRNVCDGCHGGADTRSEWGMTSFYPRAPQFGIAAPPFSEPEIFWIVKNGIRYTGMAAAASDLGDDDIWKIAMFLSRLDALPEPVKARWHEK